jgi:hypothetical protein
MSKINGVTNNGYMFLSTGNVDGSLLNDSRTISTNMDSSEMIVEANIARVPYLITVIILLDCCAEEIIHIVMERKLMNGCI